MNKILKKKGYFLKHNETLKFLEKTKSIKKILYKRFVPLITDKYNVKLKSDKNLDFIDLKEFGFKLKTKCIDNCEWIYWKTLIQNSL